MNRILDFLALIVALFVGNLFWCTYVFHRFWAAAVVALGIAVAVALLLSKLLTREDKKPYSVDKLSVELALKGNAYALELIRTAMEKRGRTAENKGEYLAVCDRALFCRFKFNDANAEDIAQIFRTVQQLATEGTLFREIVVCARGFDKNALLLAEALPVQIRSVKTRAVFRFLRSVKALPELTTKKKISRLPARDLLGLVFQRRNVKYFLFSAVVLGILAYFTPLKIYYIALSAVNLTAAVVCLCRSFFGTKESKGGELW